MKTKKNLKIYNIPVVVEKDGSGYFFAYAPSLQGCYTQGKSLSESLDNIKEVVELHLADRLQAKEAFTSRKPVSLSSLEIRIAHA